MPHILENRERKTLIDFYKQVSPSLDERLIHKSIVPRLNSFFKYLPPFNLVNLEVRLNDENYQVDPNILIHQYECKVLKKWIDDHQDPKYEVLSKWCEAWTNPNLLFSAIVPNIWLMYDFLPDQIEIPEPWIIVAVHELNLDVEAILNIYKNIASYFPNEYNDNHWQLFEKALELLPEGTYIPAIGIQNRNLNSLRFGIKSFNSMGDIENYLLALGWPGDLNFIKRHYTKVVELSEYCDLSLTFGEKIFPEIGLECYLSTVKNEENGKEIISYLYNKNLCSEDKKNALFDWFGKSRDFEEVWDVYPPIYNKTKRGYIHKWISEIKMVYNPGHKPTSKAYLIFDRKFS